MNIFNKNSFAKSFNKYSELLKNTSNKGFTLPEVLITLVIIGVIAIITIPPIQHQQNRKMVETRLKKVYSDLTNVYIRAQADYGMMSGWSFEEYENQSSSNVGKSFLKTYILPYINYQKCETMSLADWGYKKGIIYPNKTLWQDPSKKCTGFITQNGTFIMLAYTMVNGIVQVINFNIDVDGPHKGPNMVGKDIFAMHQFVDDNANLQMGVADFDYWYAQETQYQVRKTTRDVAIKMCKDGNVNAFNCGLVIQNDGWQITKNYPWL